MPSSRTSYESGSTPRGRTGLLVIAAIAVSALIAGLVVLGLVDVAPVPQSVEKVIPSDRLLR